MEKLLDVTETRQSLSELVDEVHSKGDTVVLTKNNEPSAVMIPIELFEQWKKEREERFAVIDEVQECNRDIDMSDDKLMNFVNEVVHQVRTEK